MARFIGNSAGYVHARRRVCTELQLTASGKILKRELVAMIQRGELEPTPVRWLAKEMA
jgi:acyl-CoA synthetase (AMP-forming)/AMP-acid ligase II